MNRSTLTIVGGIALTLLCTEFSLGQENILAHHQAGDLSIVVIETAKGGTRTFAIEFDGQFIGSLDFGNYGESGFLDLNLTHSFPNLAPSVYSGCDRLVYVIFWRNAGPGIWPLQIVFSHDTALLAPAAEVYESRGGISVGIIAGGVPTLVARHKLAGRTIEITETADGRTRSVTMKLDGELIGNMEFAQDTESGRLVVKPTHSFPKLAPYVYSDCNELVYLVFWDDAGPGISPLQIVFSHEESLLVPAAAVYKSANGLFVGILAGEIPQEPCGGWGQLIGTNEGTGTHP